MLSLSADVGGTFTDVVLVDSDRAVLLADKVLTTPGSTGAIIAGMHRLCERAGVKPADIDVLIHGFTIATNAWLTRSGARVVLAVTDGFRDVLEIATQRRPDPYDLHLQALQPLAGRACVVEVDERIDAFGEVVRPFDRAAADRAAQRIAALEPEAVAISLLFSYLNDAHEALLADAVRRVLPDVPVYTSARINPQTDEYPRTNTTVTAAYVGPAVARYIHQLETTLPEAGMKAPVLLMRSDGGVSTVAATRVNPATMLLSGPAGGVIASLDLSRQAQAPNLITFDMGGTSADFSLIANGRARMINLRELHGEILRTPSLDIQTISSGGGSIGAVDAGGALRVGPQSAGSVPGPACYGRGGTQPTLTDAALVMGLLDANEYVGGEMTLDTAAAREAVRAYVAAPLGLSVEEAAYAMVAIANAQMAQAIRGLSIERGYDLRDFGLVSFGGAGSIFAPFLARDLGMKEVLVPLKPGVFSATGLMLTDIRYAYQRHFLAPLNELDGNAIAAEYDAMIADARDAFERDRVRADQRQYTCHADMRYIGQVHELTVELPVSALDGVFDAADARRRFLVEHERAYGFADPLMEMEVVNLRLEAAGVMPKPDVQVPVPASVDPARNEGSRTLYLGPETGNVTARVLARDTLAAGESLDGPLIVNQPDTTILVLPQQRMTVDADGILRIRANEAS
ncbi:hydantoinase/oxoprolinase family protein [Paraburkholderia tropica]|uniref:hydantoinase/oxoprolinase family protein n=1 Tax=Paraburkholderia tropica TaxID=92647 RepID=UPI002AB788EF|nr:hydantoinase/oxoprolinase family protein [Paraburkholderia tropica]